VLTYDEGATVVRRDLLDGRVWSATPFRALRDSNGVLLLALWPGITSMAPKTWVDSQLTGDDQVRRQGLPDLARGEWRLDRWVWRDTGRLSWVGVDPGFSVDCFFDVSGRPLNWYLNFERLPVRTPLGIDTFDLLLDMVIAPDLTSWKWKDEDEYAHARRLGLIDDQEHRRVSRARERAVALVSSRGGPFAESRTSWRASPEWAVPVLPEVS